MHTAILAPRQVRLLAKCEAVIARGGKIFVEVGCALLQIKQEKLYLRDYETFADYCKMRWGFEKNYANKLIASARVVGNIISVAGTIVPVLPATETQARPLTKLEPEQQVSAWQEVIAQCEEESTPVTAAIVEAVVERYEEDKPKPKAKDKPSPTAEPAPKEEPAEEPKQDFCGYMNAALEAALRQFNPPKAAVVAWMETKALQYSSDRPQFCNP